MTRRAAGDGVAESCLYFAEARLPDRILAGRTGDGRVHPRQIDVQL